jgi:SAM-dependent MidA family methyltransferase
VAQQTQSILSTLNEGDILEIGAGSGKFAKDLLLELEQRQALPKNYFIVEKSAGLRTQQQHLLKTDCAHLFERIHWLADLPTQNKMTGVIIANEVLDALPFHCFRIEEDGIKERCVIINPLSQRGSPSAFCEAGGFSIPGTKNYFTWKTTEPITPALTQHVKHILEECPLGPGYESEVNLAIDQWIPQVANCLNKGVILLFDYGYGRREYYHPDRTHGTFMCFHQHQRHTDPFQWIGLQDMTAHVDFTAVIENAVSANLKLGGYTTQSSFLLACGLLDLANQPDLSTADQYQQNQAIKKLTLPSQMGELIKVMALTKDYKEPLIGFSLHDRSRNL